MKNKVNEWQELSLKKDIEKILRVISHNTPITYAFTFDFAIAVITVVLDKLLSPADDSNRTWLFWIMFVLSCVPFVIILFIIIKNLALKRNSFYSVHSISNLIDSFDNDICYYVMMADTYNKMFRESIKQGDNNVAVFYYIETWYYINKTKSKMHMMLYKTTQIFTNEPNDVLQRNQIMVSRLANIVMIMEDIRISSNELIARKKLNLPDQSITDINKKYDISFRHFIDQVNADFGSSIKIDFDEIDRFVT